MEESRARLDVRWILAAFGFVTSLLISFIVGWALWLMSQINTVATRQEALQERLATQERTVGLHEWKLTTVDGRLASIEEKLDRLLIRIPALGKGGAVP